MERGEIKRLAVFMLPGSAKSTHGSLELAAILTSAGCELGKRPLDAMGLAPG
jgi:hypothetical protein